MVAALASDINIKKDFVEELWNVPVPFGIGRYYDGLLYMLAILQVSGNFKIYKDQIDPVQDIKKPSINKLNTFDN